jgi:hypothetical protein
MTGANVIAEKLVCESVRRRAPPTGTARFYSPKGLIGRVPVETMTLFVSR